MLERLKALGIRIGVVTSKRRHSTVRDLEVFQIAGYIDAVVAAEDVAYPKPAADAVEEALRRLGAQSTEAWMVGDWITDLQAARAAHVATVAALWGTRDKAALLAVNPDYVAERPADIVRLLSG
jgi:pyrophosphatase PpaX